METKTYKNWWFPGANGLISILFGLMLLLCTKEIIQGIILYFGIIILLAGIGLLIASVYSIKREKKAGFMIVQTISSIALGIFIIVTPKEDILRIFLLLIGIWAIIVGIIQIVLLVNVGKRLQGKNTVLFNGLLTIALGVVLCFKPFEFAGIAAKILGAFAVLFGIIMIYLSFLLRKIPVDPQEKTGGTA
jgi:uncharacterized membrane protein HdeD (DUF308 family)